MWSRTFPRKIVKEGWSAGRGNQTQQVREEPANSVGVGNPVSVREAHVTPLVPAQLPQPRQAPQILRTPEHFPEQNQVI